MRHRLLVLALGTFAIGTGSFVFAGLLEGVANDLFVSVGTAGNLVTVFAVTYAVASPVLVTLTGGAAPRKVLVAAMAVFAAANLAAVFAPTFGLLLACRIAAACGAAVFTPTALAVAAGLSPPEERGRSISTITGGLTVSFVVGIPLGSIIGTYAGWRMTFVMVAVLGAVAMLGVRALPRVEPPPVVGLKERVDALRQRAVVAALALTTLGLMGGFVVFTYVSPLLAEITGFGGAGVSGLLFLFGVAALLGNWLGGYGADHVGYARLMAAILALLSLSLLGFSLLVNAAAGTALAVPGTVATLMLWGVAGFALNPLQQYRVSGLAPDTRNVALSLNASAIYLGQGAGAGLGALALANGSLATLGWTGSLCALAALALLLLTTKAKHPKPAPEV